MTEALARGDEQRVKELTEEIRTERAARLGVAGVGEVVAGILPAPPGGETLQTSALGANPRGPQEVP